MGPLSGTDVPPLRQQPSQDLLMAAWFVVML